MLPQWVGSAALQLEQRRSPRVRSTWCIGDMYRQTLRRRRHLMTVDQGEQGLRRAQLLLPTRERWNRVVPPVQVTVQPVERLPGQPKVGPLQAAQLLELLLAAQPSSCRPSQMALHRHIRASVTWLRPVRKE